MTRRITISAIIILTAIVSLAIAQEAPRTKPARPKSKDQARTRTRTSLQNRPARSAAQRPGLDRSRMMDMQLKQMEAQIGMKKAEMQKAIAELKTVLAIAQEEKATKTAAALQKIIDNKQAKLDAETKTFEMRTQRLKEQYEKRMQQMDAPQRPKSAATPNKTRKIPAKPTGKVEKK